ncbi:MAG: hypothetical protein KY432_07770 [Acidobacteria bacterium]|nr:hypothetical protein [Acidobacteriota bacterium]
MIYRVLLGIHSWNRWVVLILGIVLVAVAWQKLMSRAHTSATMSRFSIWFITSVDIQFLLGIFLMFVSPVIATFMNDPGAAMSRPSIRFWAVEHTSMMLIATILAHVGRVMVKAAGDATVAHRRGAIMFTIALIVILVSIPWPFREQGRALFFF